jgi:hypothetical protein
MGNGYEVIPDVFSIRETENIASCLEVLPLERSRAGARHLLRQSEIASLARDPRLTTIASVNLGGPARPFGATLFDKSPQANWLVAWHQDTALPVRERIDISGWGPWSVKHGVQYAHAPASALAMVVALRVHLDDSTSDNGPLRVIPNSHTCGVLTDDLVRELVGRSAPATCLVNRGGVVAMQPLIVHASSKVLTNAPRRVIHIEYSLTDPAEWPC